MFFIMFIIISKDKNSLYEYATMKADEIEQLEEEMRKLGTEPVILYDVVSDGDSDMDSD